jgi:hypothetical protein
MIIAKLLVPSGGSETLMGGGVSLPSQVNCFGTVLSSANAELFIVNGMGATPYTVGDVK